MSLTDRIFGSDAQADADLDSLDLSCPACNADLTHSDVFRVYRICPGCRRHFWMPARERIMLLVDGERFAESNAAVLSIDPLVFRDRLPVADRLAEERDQSGIAEAIITGIGEIDRGEVVTAALDLAVIGSGVGILATEKILLAMETALARRLPFVAICSGGTTRSVEGILSLAQLPRLAGMASRMHRSGIPTIAILTHPTAGNVFLALAGQSDLAFAEPGAQIGFSTSGGPTEATSGDAASVRASAIDATVDREELRGTLSSVIDLLTFHGRPRSVPGAGVAVAEAPSVFNGSMETTEASALLAHMTDQFVELHGDRQGDDERSVIGGIARIDGTAIVAIAADHGAAASASGFRKAGRLLRLAAHFELPVLIVASPGRDEARFDDGGAAAARFLGLLTALPTPVVSLIAGEIVGSNGFLFATCDRVLIRSNAAFRVSGSETVTTPSDCLRLGLADELLSDDDEDAGEIRRAVSRSLVELGGLGSRRLLDERARKLRHLGLTSPEGRDAARLEITELQEIQKLVARSWLDLRHRWDRRQLGLPNLQNMPSLNQLSSRTNLPSMNLPKINIRRPDIADLTNRFAARRSNERGPTEPESGED